MAPQPPQTTSKPIVCQTEIPKTVLGIGAHPDDMDFLAAGTVAAWVAAGAKAYYLVLTNGNKGSADLSADPQDLTDMRRKEQREAAKILGVSEVFFCDYDDGELQCSMDVKKDIVRIIRTVRPDTVITMDPTLIYDVELGHINHPDHRAAGQAALDAVFPLARDHLSLPELYKDEGLEPHKVSTVYLTRYDTRNCYIDITQTMDTKIQALAAHGSQYEDLPAFEARLRAMAAKLGFDAGVRYAEGFIRLDVQ
jgi:LmbE family N-acetylglucosaminyl deacetylase